MTGRMLDERLGKIELLDDVHRVQRHVLPDAHPRRPRACRGGSTPTSNGLGWDTLNLIVSIGSVVFAARHAAHAAQLCCWSLRRGEPAPRRPVGRRHARVVDRLAAARVQLRRDPGRRRAAIRCGTSAPLAGRGDRRDEPATRALGVDGRAREADAGHRGASTRVPQDVLEHPRTDRPPVRRSRSASRCSSSGCSSRPRWSAWSACVVGRSRLVRWALADRGGPPMSVGRASPHRAGRPRRTRAATPTGVVGDGRADHDRGDDLRRPARRVLLRARGSPRSGRRRASSRPSCAASVLFSVILLGEQHPDLLDGARDPARVTCARSRSALAISVRSWARRSSCNTVLRLPAPGLRLARQRVRLALLRDHRAARAARARRSADERDRAGQGVDRAGHAPSTTSRPRCSRCTGTSSTSCGSSCSRPSSSRRTSR